MAQGPRREPLLRQRAADDHRAHRAHVPVRPLRAAGLAADAAPASPRERSGCASGGPSSARPHASLCAIRSSSQNGFTGPIPASITALTRLAVLCAPPPPVRSPGRLGHAERARCGADTSPRTASPAACRRRSPRCARSRTCAPPLHGRARRRCGACVAARARGSSSARPHASLCVARDLAENGFTGPILASITALTRLAYLCAPFARRGSPPTRRMPCFASAAAAHGRSIFGVAACLAVRDQVLGQEWLHRPDPREHLGAHRAGRTVRRAVPRSVSRPTRAC
jgi:hypothetical protein